MRAGPILLCTAMFFCGCNGSEGKLAESQAEATAAKARVKTQRAEAEFARARAEIEAKIDARRQAHERARSFITVRFKKIDHKGLPVMTVTNATGRDIDNVSGGFHIEDQAGNYLFATGHTEAVRGAVFLGANESKDIVPFGLVSKTKVMELLRDEPEMLLYSFDAREITFADGTVETRGN